MKVAMVQCSDGEWRTAVSRKHWTDESQVWVFEDGMLRDHDASVSRPLVVLDPENREQVERLAAIYIQQPRSTSPLGTSDTSADLQAALREFASPTPTRPSEPQGLGAVVEDAEGERWVRATACDTDCPEVPYCYPWVQYNKKPRTYADITTPRVLSEGVVE